MPTRPPPHSGRRTPESVRQERQTGVYAALRRRVLAEEVFCGRCGKEVQKWRRGNDPLAGTMGHIIPAVLGGPLVRWNVRLEHKVCNERSTQW